MSLATFRREIDTAPALDKVSVVLYHLRRRLRLGDAPRPLRTVLRPGPDAAVAAPVRVLTNTAELGSDLGIWDQVVEDYFRLPAFVPRGAAVVVDIGANIGLYTLLVCALAPAARVYAFEPMPHPFARLLANCRLNDLQGVCCEPVALGDRTARRSMYAVGGGDPRLAQQGAFEPAVIEGWRRPDAPGMAVAQETLDAYAERQGLGRIDLVKVDAEGAERDILAGMEGSLARIGALVLEWHGAERRAWATEYLRARGFRLALACTSFGTPEGGATGIQYFLPA